MMLTNFLPFALLATPIISAPLAPPELKEAQSFIDKSIKEVLENVIDSTIALSIIVKGFDGNVQNAGPIVTASQGLLDTLNNGTKIVQEAHILDYVGLLAITGPTLDLNKAVDKVAEALIAKKPLFEKALLVPVVLEQLKLQKTAARALVNTLLTKVPLGTVTLGKTLSAPSLQGLDDAIAVFGGKGENGWGSGPSSSDSTAAPQPLSNSSATYNWPDPKSSSTGSVGPQWP